MASLIIIWAFVAMAAVGSVVALGGKRALRFALLRTSVEAAQMAGIDTTRMRSLAFLASAAYAGLGGSLLAHVTRVVSPDLLGLDTTVTILSAVVIGGRGWWQVRSWAPS